MVVGMQGELSEELMRQREKERLRKEYIEELKRRFEEEKSSLEQTLAAEQVGGGRAMQGLRWSQLPRCLVVCCHFS